MSDTQEQTKQFLDNSQVAQVKMYVDWLIDAFNNTEDLPSDGVWKQHTKNPKLVIAGTRVIGTMKSAVDAGYIVSLQPHQIKMLILYIKQLELEKEKSNV